MVNWETNERGSNRADERPDGRQMDYDGLSCMHLQGLPGYGADIEDIDENPLV